MISHLRGIIVEKQQSASIIEVGGIGFEVNMSARCLSNMENLGSQVVVYTYMHVREDSMQLFGFLTQEEKKLFIQLISVSGIGPKVALAALSFYSPADLCQAISNEDVARVSKIPGIGKKTASRLILELKGTLETSGLSQSESEHGNTNNSHATACSTSAKVIEALLSMGFTSAEAELSIKGADEGMSENNLLRYALKNLGSK